MHAIWHLVSFLPSSDRVIGFLYIYISLLLRWGTCSFPTYSISCSVKCAESADRAELKGVTGHWIEKSDRLASYFGCRTGVRGERGKNGSRLSEWPSTYAFQNTHNVRPCQINACERWSVGQGWSGATLRQTSGWLWLCSAKKRERQGRREGAWLTCVRHAAASCDPSPEIEWDRITGRRSPFFIGILRTELNMMNATISEKKNIFVQNSNSDWIGCYSIFYFNFMIIQSTSTNLERFRLSHHIPAK